MVHSPGPSKRGNRLVVTLKEAGPYHFRRATMNDLDLLMTWQFHNHVSTWWDSDEPFDLEELSDPKVSRWIVSFEDRPFAYMQDYSVHGWCSGDVIHRTRGWIFRMISVSGW